MRVADRYRLRRRAEFAVVSALVAFVAMLAVAGAAVGGEALLAKLGGVGAPTVALLLALSLLNYGCRLLRWHLFSRRLGLGVPLRRNALFYIAGFAMTTTPGRIGETLRLWLLQRCDGCRYEDGGAMLIADRLSDAVATLCLCLVGVAAFADHAGVTLTLAAVAAGVIGLFARPAPLLWSVAQLYRWSGRFGRLLGRLRTLLRQTARLFDLRLYGVAMAITLTGWFGECCALYLLLDRLDAEISLQAATFTFAFAMLVGGLTMLPGGLGGTEATMMALLLALDVPADTAIVAVAVNRLTTLWFAVSLGLLALPVSLRLARRA